MSIKHPYGEHAYADSLSHLGRALHVPEWDTSVLVRDMGQGLQDAMGTYPLAILPESADMAGGLKRLRQAGLVSVVLVLDDFHRPPIDEMERHFGMIRPFKSHYIYRPGQGEPRYDTHHRYELRQALKNVRTAPLDWSRDAEAWITLYSSLIARHNLSQSHQFPREHHQFLARTQGVQAIGAWHEEELVCAHLWVTDGDFVHSHLAASSEAGYRFRAGYAVNDASLRFFSGARLVNLGGGAGNSEDKNDGLARFKRGFCNSTAYSYICGAILDKQRYAELTERAGAAEKTDFFPAYRAPVP